MTSAQALQLIQESFPVKVAHDEANYSTNDSSHEHTYCVELLLELPWNKLLEHDLFRGRLCFVVLTPGQMVHCLPAYLCAVVDPPRGIKNEYFFEILEFVLGALEPIDDILLRHTNLPQREAIAAALAVASENALEFGSEEDRDDLLFMSWWWAEKAQALSKSSGE